MHEVEGEMKADDEEPEVPFAELLAHHAAGDFGIPVVEGGEERKEDCADQNIVEVCHDKVGVAELPVEGGRRRA